MRLSKVLIQVYLLIYFCFGDHSDDQIPTVVEQNEIVLSDSESFIATTDIHDDNTSIKTESFKSDFENLPDDLYLDKKYEGESTEASVITDESTEALNSNARSEAHADRSSTKTQIQSETTQRSLSDHSNDNNSSNSERTAQSGQLNSTEQMTPLSTNISSLPNQEQDMSDTIGKSNLSISHTQSSAQKLIRANVTIKNESHVPIPTTSKMLLATSSKLKNIVRAASPYPRTNEQLIENSSRTDFDNQTENITIEAAHDEQNHPEEPLPEMEESILLDVNNISNNETQIYDEKTNDNQSVSADVELKTVIDLSTTPKLNNSEPLLTNKTRQLCWHLPKLIAARVESIENHIYPLVYILPKFLQALLFGDINDREVLMNLLWFAFCCGMYLLSALIFLSMGAKCLQQTRREQQVRTRCQQLQQYNNQIELERETFERQNQKLSDEIDDLRNASARDADEDIFTLRKECNRCEEDLKVAYARQSHLEQDIDCKQTLIGQYQADLKRQKEANASLNKEIAQLKLELDKERATVRRLELNDVSLERFEKCEEIIQTQKSVICQLKEERLAQNNQLEEIQDHVNQLSIENNRLVTRVKLMRNLIEQHDNTRKALLDKINHEPTSNLNDLVSILNNSSSSDNERSLKTIDNEVKLSEQRAARLCDDLQLKTRRLKELEHSLTKEKENYRALETKLKTVFELQERNNYLHTRRLGLADNELRRAMTDADRIRILEEKLEQKQKELEDVQRELANEQTKSIDKCGKLEHDRHEKWMEIKRLTRELDSSRKECESLRRHIARHSTSKTSSHDKSSESTRDTDVYNTSPSFSHQTGDRLQISDCRSDESGAGSPTNMVTSRSPLYYLPPPSPFIVPPFMPPPLINPFMVRPIFPKEPLNPYDIASPVLYNNNNENSSEVADSSNTVQNSMQYEEQLNATNTLLLPTAEEQIKTKKPKKILKKKTKTSATIVITDTTK